VEVPHNALRTQMITCSIVNTCLCSSIFEQAPMHSQWQLWTNPLQAGTCPV